MLDIVPLLTAASVPIISSLSLTVYLLSQTTSPFSQLLYRPPIQLPSSAREDSSRGLRHEDDKFLLEDENGILGDGRPVFPDKFWRSVRRKKLLFLGTLSPALACNVALLVLGGIYSERGPSMESQTIFPLLILPSQVVSFAIGVAHLHQQEVPEHWATTIHQNLCSFVQFVCITLVTLMDPVIHLGSSGKDLSRIYSILHAVLPVCHLLPMAVIMTIRRGPPLRVDLSAIYPAKVLEGMPADCDALKSDLPNVSEEVEATVPEWLLFSHGTPVVWKGYVSESMEVWDLPALQANMRSLSQYRIIRKIYSTPSKGSRFSEGYNLLLKLAKANWAPLLAQSVLAAITAVGYYGPHALLMVFLRFLESDTDRSKSTTGWLLAFGLFISNALIYLASGVLWSISTVRLQAGIKLQLNAMLFAKTLVKKDVAGKSDTMSEDKVDGDANVKEDEKDEDENDDSVTSKSQIMNLFTVDVDRVTEFVFHEFSIIDAPLEIGIATAFLLKLLGSSAVFGMLATLLLLPVNHLANKVIMDAQENLMKARDGRTALMNELLQGIRMIKFMAWERMFENRVREIRNRELKWQARNYQLEIVLNCVWGIAPVLVTVVAFLHFTLVRGKTLTPSIAFTAIAIFFELSYALTVLPETFIQALQGFISCRRIEKYLCFPEITAPTVETASPDITLINATITWPRDPSAADKDPTSVPTTPKTAFMLFDLNMRFPRGKLSLVCGKLGSGKSLLLAGLLGEADLLAGSIDCPRSQPDAMADSSLADETAQWIRPNMVAYVPQQAWLQNASIKNNVIFSSPWDDQRYHDVLEACCLKPDLEILEDGDETEIGEKGLNLSGGQKARVSLARAVYSRAQTLFLDDVLSAVDAHTAHALVEGCLKGSIMEGRTVVLVSHHTALVSPAAAYIVALENGAVKFSGSRAEFVACGLMESLDGEEAAPILVDVQDTKPQGDHSEKPLPKTVSSLNMDQQPDSETSSLAPDDAITLAAPDPDSKIIKKPRKLMEDEKRARGRIALSVWKLYVGSLGSYIFWFVFIVALVVEMLGPVAQNGWLQYWTGSHENRPYHSTTYYVVIYAVISLVMTLLENAPYVVIYYGSLQASRKLHSVMLERVLFATLRFHDTTSRGRLLNRFGKDIEGLDSEMADHFSRSIAYFLNAVVTVASITYVGGIPFALAGSLVLVVYYRAGSIYGQASRDMRRLDSVTKSPLYSLFGETVSGIAVLRAFGAGTVALRNMLQLADTNMLAFYWTWTVNRWLSARFNILSSFVVGLSAVAILISPSVSASMAGFALTFAGTLSHDLLFVVRRFVQLEQSMVALERIKEYSEVEIEAPEHVEPRPSASWPERGEIQVEDLVIRYAPDLPDVLHSLNFSVKSQEKIGIVGSTGCGKSTLALSFFRFVEATKGRIVIDGIDISKIGLTDLRSRVTIIPQDPTILSGTLRSTLDVFDEYDDADIYEALRRVHLLKSAEEEAADEEQERNANVFRDLSNPVSEGGDNFSSGEKQLICMARAILKRNRLLFMDEATASIDYETDELISKTIREEFSQSTILTIAHRIRTIIDFDKVLVMDRGRIVEFARPAELLRDHRSRFYALCKATGKSEFKILKEAASAAEARAVKADNT